MNPDETQTHEAFEITEAMIEAGVFALAAWDRRPETIVSCVSQIFRSMFTLVEHAPNEATEEMVEEGATALAWFDRQSDPMHSYAEHIYNVMEVVRAKAKKA